jgi:Rrf2 family protein
MRKMSARAEYALLAVLDLARHSSQKNPVEVGRVAERTGASRKYLVQILQRLKKKLIVNSERGRSGGYYLVRPPRQISAAQVLEAVAPDGDEETDDDAGAPEDAAIVRRTWRRAEEARMQELSEVSIAEMLRQADHGAGTETE